MASVLLFHHAQGLTKGIRHFADQLRADGHDVTTPDLYDGHTFDVLDDGIGYAREVGFETVLARGVVAADELASDLVYAGCSLGVMPAQRLAQTRPGARGALLYYACLPVTEFSDAWPKGVPVQVHGMDHDPSFTDEGDLDAARALVEEADDAELFLYAGSEHLFADSSLPSYDEAAAGLLLERTLEFLNRLE